MHSLYIYNKYMYIYIYAIMKTMCPPSYHHSSFVATHARRHVGSWTLLVPMNQRVLNKQIKKCNLNCHWSLVIHDKQSAQISQKQDGRNIYNVYMYMCTYIYIYIYTHTHIYIYIYIYTYIYVYIYVDTDIDIFIYSYTYRKL